MVKYFTFVTFLFALTIGLCQGQTDSEKSGSIFYKSAKVELHGKSRKELPPAYLGVGCSKGEDPYLFFMLGDMVFTKSPAHIAYTSDLMDEWGVFMSNITEDKRILATSNTKLPDSISHSNYKILQNIRGAKIITIAISGSQVLERDVKEIEGVVEYTFITTDIDRGIVELQKKCK